MNIGFIGCGNMAGAMIGGILGKGIASPADILASAKFESELAAAKERFGIRTTMDNREVAKTSDILVLAVKPDVIGDVIRGISDAVRSGTTVVSLAPGRPIAWLEEQFGHPLRLVRTMPNTPALAGEGMTALCPNEQVGEAALADVLALFRSFGEAEIVREKDIDAVTAISGSSPAYVFMFIEAMADAAVAEGMTRAQAYRFAAQATAGSAKMVLETGKHPGELKDMVCSPGGTTIEAVQVLEQEGFRSAVIDAVRACAQKAREL